MSTLTSESLFRKPCVFVMGVADMDGLPPPQYPEVAFAGRSNVGKSSIINAVTGHGGLAKASNTPGRTRELNFFLLAEKLMLVDLPGYGYAKAGRGDVKRWTHLVNDYLTGRPNLQRVILLIDSRHGFKDTDHEIMKLLDVAAVSYQIVLTKSDKITPSALKANEASVVLGLKKHPAAHPHIIATSSVGGDGIETLRGSLAAFVLPQRK